MATTDTYNRRKDAGQCVTCGGKPQPGRRRCAGCAKDAAKSVARRRKVLTDAGLCWRCRVRAPERGKGQCEPCNKKARRVARKAVGQDLAVVDRIYREAGGLCAICNEPAGRKRALDIDHDRVTLKMRGVLCGSCNKGLGFFRDDPALLRIAALYIEEHRDRP